MAVPFLLNTSDEKEGRAQRRTRDEKPGTMARLDTDKAARNGRWCGSIRIIFCTADVNLARSS
jgi:hypothetical protein